MARFDSDAVQRFEAAKALATAIPSTFSVDHHADVLARYVTQTAAEVFPKAMARRKKDWISDDTWKTHPREEADSDGAEEGSCVARSMQALEGMGRLGISQCCGVSCNRSVKVCRGESEGRLLYRGAKWQSSLTRSGKR